MNSKKSIMTIIAIVVLMVALVGATFAYFRAQQGGTSIHDVSVTSNTTDNLSFTIGNDITFTASEANFGIGGTNVSGSTTATAILTPNNKTNQATMNYYMYLNLTSNPTVYSAENTNRDAELVLQVFDGSNQLVTLTGLGNQVALGNGYGYDITGKEGLITLLDNHTITANSGTTTENWSVVITLVNLNLDQNDNTHKTITGEIIIQKDEMSQPFCDAHPEDLKCYVMDNYDASTMATGTTNLLYYHDGNLEDGIDDESYRYAGSNPNNYVCFGSNETPCPAANLYRIIGFVPVNVLEDATDSINVITNNQTLYKLIKNDYITAAEIGLTEAQKADLIDNEDYNGVPANHITTPVSGFIWSDLNYSNSSHWSDSSLKLVGLNKYYLSNLGGEWVDRIANVLWKTPENATNQLYMYPSAGIYAQELLGFETPSIIENFGKVGLMYAFDASFMAPSSYWEEISCDSINNPYNWIQRGVKEWTISKPNSSWAFTVYGYIEEYNDINSADYAAAVRPVFYLNPNAIIDKNAHVGTQADQYRVTDSSNLTHNTYYTVTYNTDGGNAIQSEVVAANSTTSKPFDPVKESSTFNGWKLNNQSFNFSTPITNNITLVADWIAS